MMTVVLQQPDFETRVHNAMRIHHQRHTNISIQGASFPSLKKTKMIMTVVCIFQAVATRDAMAKCLYGALFDWIVLKVNQALLAKKHNSEHQVCTVKHF